MCKTLQSLHQIQICAAKRISECENVALIFILFEFYGFYEFLRVSTGFMTLSR